MSPSATSTYRTDHVEVARRRALEVRARKARIAELVDYAHAWVSAAASDLWLPPELIPTVEVADLRRDLGQCRLVPGERPRIVLSGSLFGGFGDVTAVEDVLAHEFAHVIGEAATRAGFRVEGWDLRGEPVDEQHGPLFALGCSLLAPHAGLRLPTDYASLPHWPDRRPNPEALDRCAARLARTAQLPIVRALRAVRSAEKVERWNMAGQLVDTPKGRRRLPFRRDQLMRMVERPVSFTADGPSSLPQRPEWEHARDGEPSTSPVAG